MTDTTTVSEAKANGLSALGFARKNLTGLLEGIPEDKRTYHPANGNHVTWILGHLAWADDFFLKELAGTDPTCPEAWNELFGMGSEPTDDPRRYPPYEELLGHFHHRREALVEWFTGLDDSRLTEPLKEEWKGFAENLGSLMSSLAMVLCLSALQEGNVPLFRKWCFSTAILGAVFLGFQAFEFTEFYWEGLGFTSNVFGSSFFALTGTHGAHVFVGVMLLTTVGIWSYSHELNPVVVEVIGLYWHFVDVIWIVIFTLVYLFVLAP